MNPIGTIINLVTVLGLFLSALAWVFSFTTFVYLKVSGKTTNNNYSKIKKTTLVSFVTLIVFFVLAISQFVNFGSKSKIDTAQEIKNIYLELTPTQNPYR